MYRCLVRYWMVGDVMLTTGIRDGVNLLPMEYCVTKNERPGVLIIRWVNSSHAMAATGRAPPPPTRTRIVLHPCVV